MLLLNEWLGIRMERSAIAKWMDGDKVGWKSFISG